MSNTTTIRPTAAEQKTAKLKARFSAHIHEWWPTQDAEFADKDYNFHIEDGPFQLWSCDLSNRRTPISPGGSAPVSASATEHAREDIRGVTLWLLWDRKEVSSYDDEGEAYSDLINGQKALRLDSKLKYYTSPLTVSAILAIILFLLIAALEILRYDVPNQLWSVFTAVVAFYFGRESSRTANDRAIEE